MNFSHRQVRFIQFALLLCLVIGVVWMGAALNRRQSSATVAGPIPASGVLRLGKGTIEQLAASPNGRTIAVRTVLGLFVYRADDLQSLWQETELEIFQVGFSPDGRILWGMTADGLVGWDAAIGARRLSLGDIWRDTTDSLWLEGPHTWAIMWEHGLPHTLAAPAPCGYQNEHIPEPVTLMCIVFIDVVTGRVIEQLPTVVQLRSRLDPRPVSDQPVNLHLGYSSAAGEFSIAVQDRLWFWDPDGQLLTGATPLPGSLSIAPVFSPDAMQALLLIHPTVYVFDRLQSTLLPLDPLPEAVLSLLYTLDGRRILVGTSTGMVYEIGRQSRWIIQRYDLGEAAVRLARGQDLDSILLEDGRGRLARWRRGTGSIETSIDGFWAPSAEAAWSPSEDQLAIVSRPSTLVPDDPRLLTLWGLDGNRVNQMLFGERIIDIAWSYDGEMIAVGTWSAGGRVQWLEEDSLDVQREYVLDDDGLCGLAWSSDGRTAVATTELNVLIFEAESVSPVLALDARDLWLPPGAACRGVVWSPDGSMIALEIANGRPLFWDGADGHPIDRLNPDPLDNRASTVSIGWNLDGEPLMAGYDQAPGERDLEFRVSGIAQSTTLWVNLAHNSFELTLPDVPNDFAWSPDGTRLAIAYQETIEIVGWSLESGVHRRMLDGHSDDIVGLEWSWQGEYLASYSLDGSILIWQIDELHG